MLFSKRVLTVLVLVCALTGSAAWADFRISGGGNGANNGATGMDIVTSDVVNPASFVVTGTTPADDHDVNFHVTGSYTDTDATYGLILDWTNDMYFRADTVTGEIGAALLSHTHAPYASRSGPYSYIDVNMRDTFHIDSGGGFEIGDPVNFVFNTAWHGQIFLEGQPSGGCYVHYRARLRRAGTILHELDSVSNSLYPSRDEWVNESLNEIISGVVGDTYVVEQYISFDLNGSEYSRFDDAEGDNNLDFLNTGSANLGYAPGYETLNISSDGGAVILPEPASATLMLLGVGAILRRRKARR